MSQFSTVAAGIAPTSGRAPLALTAHAHRRAARRNVWRDGVEYVTTYGRMYQRTGAIFYFLGVRDVPAEDRRNPRASGLVGTVVIVASNGNVITTYRNRNAPRTIARKAKYRLAAHPPAA
ncbi:MAG: hypothetical protein ACHQ4H_12265 [Ktedonobacterales bacterium]|jgi:hypothetical protein